jgi:Zn-dependent M28 family amino/carboxypeptidase
MCLLPGDTSRVIVVGAHYDHVERGQGILDNWSGASLLPALYDSLAAAPRQHTFLFIAFSGEEKGLLGSQAYLQQISPEEKQRIVAMINLDTLGITPTKVWANHADPTLLSALETVAHRLKLPLDTVNVDKYATADSESFRNENVPSITVHSVTPENFRLLHSSGDNPGHLNFQDYYKSYRLLAEYLVYVDRVLPAGENP